MTSIIYVILLRNLVLPYKGRFMIRASYKHAIQWIAMNDISSDDKKLDIEAMSKKSSVILIAHIFQQPANKVAIDIIRHTVQMDQLKMAYKASLQKKTKAKNNFQISSQVGQEKEAR